MAARGWKIIFPAGRECRKLDSLDRRISRSMESVETIVSNLASLGTGETGRLSASTTALEQEGSLPSLPRQLARSSLLQSRRGDKWGEAGRPRPGEEMVRSIGGGWHEYRNLNGRSFTISSRISGIACVILKSAHTTGSSTTTVRQTKLVGSLLVESKAAKLWPQVMWNQ